MFHEYYELIDRNRDFTAFLFSREIINYFKDKVITGEIEPVLQWLEKKPVRMYPYAFQDDYAKMEVKVETDEEGWKYVVTNGYRMYYPFNWTELHIADYHRYLIMEQTSVCPHCYFTDEFKPVEHSTLIDCGAAEGYIGLMNIDKYDKIYLIECEPQWVEALKRTYKDLWEKVVLIEKYVSDHDDDSHITLNALLRNDDSNIIIKADIEGAETAMLRGLDGAKLKQGTKLAICTYHRQNDEETFRTLFEKNGLNAESSKGYVIPMFGSGYQAPYLRRAIMRVNVDRDLEFKFYE